MKVFRYLIPLVVFFSIIYFLAKGLHQDPKKIPSVLLQKPAPDFSLSTLLQTPEITVTPKQFLGEVWLLNVFASWCAACVDEHSILLGIDKVTDIKMVGLNYKDLPKDAIKWLDKLGNPYHIIASDIKGLVGIEYGVYGVPESFIMDKKGVIRYKHIGPISRKDAEDIILPLLAKLNTESF